MLCPASQDVLATPSAADHVSNIESSCLDARSTTSQMLKNIQPLVFSLFFQCYLFFIHKMHSCASAHHQKKFFYKYHVNFGSFNLVELYTNVESMVASGRVLAS
jgi:hypothetical protein